MLINGTTKLTCLRGDITKQDVDVIVNAANTSLLGGGGVDGAIHRAGGPAILEACRTIRDRQGRCKTGEAVITTAGKLKAKYVVHAVGPVWQGGGNHEEELLASAYRNSLRLAAEHGAATIAFPSISTGIYRFPIDRAAVIAVTTSREFAEQDQRLTEVRFVLFSDGNLQVYQKLLG